MRGKLIIELLGLESSEKYVIACAKGSHKYFKALTSQKSLPTFDNTIVALEDCGRPLSNACRFFDVYTSTMNDKPMQAIETEMKPLLTKFDDEIFQNDELFQCIKAVYDARKNAHVR